MTLDLASRIRFVVAANAVSVFAWNNQISHNGGSGVRAGNAGNLGTTGIEINGNQIDRNVGNGITISTGGIIVTFGNNSIGGNGLDGCPGCTPGGPGS